MSNYNVPLSIYGQYSISGASSSAFSSGQYSISANIPVGPKIANIAKYSNPLDFVRGHKFCWREGASPIPANSARWPLTRNGSSTLLPEPVKGEEVEEKILYLIIIIITVINIIIIIVITLKSRGRWRKDRKTSHAPFFLVVVIV